MNEYDIKRLAEVLAIQSEIEGMKAANKIRESRGDSLAYNENAFCNKADELRIIASKHNHQLL